MTFCQKLFVMCFNSLLLLGCASTPQSESGLPFAIDTAATAQAPWKAWETISSARCPFDGQSGCTRVFLGVTHDGSRVLQEFYPDGKHPLTDPYLLKPTAMWEDIGILDNLPNAKKFMYSNLDSNVVVRYESGAKYIEMIKTDQGEIQFTQWDEGGALLEEKRVRP